MKLLRIILLLLACPVAYSQTVTTAGVTFNGTNGSPVFKISQSGIEVPGSSGFIGSGVGVTNIQSTNVVYQTNNSFAGPTNALPLRNDFSLYVTAGNMSISNVTGVVSGERRWQSLWVSNSTASTTIVYLTNSIWKPIGPNTTNQINIPAGKMAILSLDVWGQMFTNYASSIQQ